jgi:hypothetical protein
MVAVLQENTGQLRVFFCPNETSKKILLQLGKSNVAISSDTF